LLRYHFDYFLAGILQSSLLPAKPEASPRSPLINGFRRDEVQWKPQSSSHLTLRDDEGWSQCLCLCLCLCSSPNLSRCGAGGELVDPGDFSDTLSLLARPIELRDKTATQRYSSIFPITAHSLQVLDKLIFCGQLTHPPPCRTMALYLECAPLP